MTRITPELSPSPFDTQTNELLHHYTSTLYLSLADNRTPTVWRVAMPQMGLAHPFLLSGIQAISALHLATLIPQRKNEFHTLALAQESAALPSFRETMRNPNPETINAIFAFAGSIVYYIMASPENFAGQNVDRCRIPSKNDEHPHWFLLMRGLMGLLVDNWEDLKKGPFRALLDTLPPGSEFTLNTIGDDQLRKLDGMFTSNDWKVEICRQALQELRIVSALSYWPSGVRSIKSSIHMWAGRISQEFVELIYERDPRALVILAHYCVMLKRNDHVWYLKGLGTRLLENIRQVLTKEWLPWIQWPLDFPVSQHDARLLINF
jgi:hypothetical protein